MNGVRVQYVQCHHVCLLPREHESQSGPAVCGRAELAVEAERRELIEAKGLTRAPVWKLRTEIVVD